MLGSVPIALEVGLQDGRSPFPWNCRMAEREGLVSVLGLSRREETNTGHLGTDDHTAAIESEQGTPYLRYHYY